MAQFNLLLTTFLFPASNPSASYGSSYTNVAPGFGSNQGAPSSQNSPGVMANVASSAVYTPFYLPVPQPESSASQPAVQRGPEASGSSSASRPVQSGYRSRAATGNPVGSTQLGAAFQPGPPQGSKSCLIVLLLCSQCVYTFIRLYHRVILN